MPSAIRGVLFDKDGTLLDFARTWVPINRAAARFAAGGDVGVTDRLLEIGGQDPTSGALRPGSALAAGTHAEVAALFAAELGVASADGLTREIERIFAEGVGRHAVLVEDAEATVAGLAAAGLVLGIATNDTAEGLYASLARPPGFLEAFRFLAGWDSGHGAKPGPGMALAFAEATGLDPRAIAVVGDSVHDLEMGRRAGVGLKVGVLGGTGDAAALGPHADRLIGRLAELPGVLAA